MPMPMSPACLFRVACLPAFLLPLLVCLPSSVPASLLILAVFSVVRRCVELFPDAHRTPAGKFKGQCGVSRTSERRGFDVGAGVAPSAAVLRRGLHSSSPAGAYLESTQLQPFLFLFLLLIVPQSAPSHQACPPPEPVTQQLHTLSGCTAVLVGRACRGGRVRRQHPRGQSDDEGGDGAPDPCRGLLGASTPPPRGRRLCAPSERSTRRRFVPCWR